jgi:hypothetical protein
MARHADIASIPCKKSLIEINYFIYHIVSDINRQPSRKGDTSVERRDSLDKRAAEGGLKI